jgi:hypothetical protein
MTFLPRPNRSDGRSEEFMAAVDELEHRTV